MKNNVYSLCDLVPGTKVESRVGIYPRYPDKKRTATVVRVGNCYSPFCEGDCVIVDEDNGMGEMWRHAIVPSCWHDQGWHIS